MVVHRTPLGGSLRCVERRNVTVQLMLRAVMLFALLLPVRAAADPFTECLRTLQSSRRARSITGATWRHVAGMQPDTLVLAQLNAQPEFTLPIWDYIAVMVDQERIDDGRRLLVEHRAIFDAVSARYGVDPHTVAAVWGIESNYGRGVGKFSVLRSLATLSCMGRRQAYFRGEFLSALRIVQAGHIAPENFLGSWAGAFGQTQFMPGIFWGRAVDFDGDGKRDLMSNVSDALGSAANYLRIAGWRTGQPWGYEVTLPDGFSTRGQGRRVRRAMSEWAVRGVRRVDGSPLIVADASTFATAGLFAPSGASGPAFLVASNFEAVFRYNAAESYTLAIVHLADRLRGSAPIVAPWPTDDLGLSRAERRELQRLLIGRGHAIGNIDGLLLPPTRAAVKLEQAKVGHVVTGRPGQRILSALRSMSRSDPP
jgi:lytic murein transglycosylase